MSASSSAGPSSRPGAQPSSDKADTLTTGRGPTTLDDAVTLVRSFGGANDTNATPNRNFQPALLPPLLKLFHSQKGKGKKVYASRLQDGSDPLRVLDPSIHTLGYTFILAARATYVDTKEEAQELVPVVAHFAQVLTPDQWRGAGEIVTMLTHGIVRLANIVEDIVWPVPSLLRILDAFRLVHGSTNNLTTVHTVVLYHLLRAAHYETAFDWIVQHDIISADAQFSPLHYSDILEYSYYCGMICAKLHKFDKASQFFDQCLCCPAQAVSALHIDAFKKLTLVHLLDKGKMTAIPNHAAVPVQRALRGRVANIEDYQSLARAFCNEPVLQLSTTSKKRSQEEQKSPEQAFHDIAANGRATFARDQNLGLVKQLIAHYLRRRLQRLSRLFVRVSLQDVVKVLDIDTGTTPQTLNQATLRVINELQLAHNDGWLQASLLDANGLPLTDTTQVNLGCSFVVFDQRKPDFASVTSAQRLMAVMKESRYWNSLVQEKERSIAQSDAYLSKLIHPRNDRLAPIMTDDLDDDAFA